MTILTNYVEPAVWLLGSIGWAISGVWLAYRLITTDWPLE